MGAPSQHLTANTKDKARSSSAQMLTPVTSQKGPLRKRRCTTKTRNGCLTCKRRRIRCDEHKPQCWNCLKSKDRVCEGYQSTQSRLLDTAISQQHSQPDANASPTDSVTESSSSIASGSSSSNTSASTTPIGTHAPRSFSLPNESRILPDECLRVPETKDREPTLAFQPSIASKSVHEVVIPRPGPLQPSFGCRVRATGNAVVRPYAAYGCGSHSAVLPEDEVVGAAALPRSMLPPTRTSARLASSEAKAGDRNLRYEAGHIIAPATTAHLPSPLTINLASTLLTRDPTTARSFSFYLQRSGAVMGGRSSPAFFLSVVPQVACSFDSVRYALLSTALVDESVDNYATQNGLNGPGVGCINQEARKASFEMYGRAVRALVSSKDGEYRSQHEKDDLLAATLITCLLLFSFEYWLWNLRNAARHLEGAMGLIQGHEIAMLGKQRRKGLLEEQVLPMMRQAAKYHDESLIKGIPASKFGEGQTWNPEKEHCGALMSLTI